MAIARHKVLLASLAVFLLAGAMGGALGVAAAKRDNVQIQGGFNVVGGPRESVSPAKFLECVDDDAWVALYLWDSSQQWRRYVNPELVGDAGYINEGAKAIETLPVGRGLYLLVEAGEPLQTVTLLDAQGENCN